MKTMASSNPLRLCDYGLSYRCCLQLHLTLAWKGEDYKNTVS